MIDFLSYLLKINLWCKYMYNSSMAISKYLYLSFQNNSGVFTNNNNSLEVATTLTLLCHKTRKRRIWNYHRHDRRIAKFQ